MALDTAPKGWRSVARYSMLTIVALFILFPVYTTVIAALKPGNRVLDNPLVPNAFTLDVLKDAWTQGRLGRYLMNTTVVALIITSVQLVTSIASAYAFSFLKFPFKRLVFGIFLSTMLVPLEVTLVVNRRTIDSLGWLNSFQGLTIPFFGNVFIIFLLRQYIKKIPNELWDAARIDGSSHLYFLRKVVIPMSMPIIVTVSLFAFILAWNSFAWPLLILTKEDWFPVTVSIYSFIREAGTNYNLLMAASLISITPVLILYFFTQKLFLESISNFGLKQ